MLKQSVDSSSIQYQSTLERSSPELTERHQQMLDWNDTASAYPSDQCVHEIFEEQAKRTPEAIALVFEGEELTYRELNERANQLAHYLLTLGVGLETLVGMCLERSVEMVVSILGILKAGGAYVPVDAEGPYHRLETMLVDAQVGIVVTQQRLSGRLPASECRVVCLDTDIAKWREHSRCTPLVKVVPENLAYVMFTSGSTGHPKGVMIRHTSIARLVFGNQYATFGPDRVFLQMAAVSFDASTFELWGSLLHGAKLIIAPPGLVDVQTLEDLLKRHRVTTLWLTSALLNHVVDQCPEALSSVSEILTGGEALSVRHISKAQRHLGPGVQLINGYGPTESTTFAVCYRIPAPVDPEAESIPIGRPIGNTQVYVLDVHGQPVPIGVAGELYIGGAGLARGYLNRPELTAEKFVTHPLSNEPGSRLYRTGDQCRWRADGNLEFLGRLDDQVKLRGFRIELGEIETVLNQHPSVVQSVVVLREDQPGDKRLVAYWIGAEDTAVNVDSLPGYLRAKLPEYMVPSAFVQVSAFPLTSNGKINRRALPSPERTRPELEGEYVTPRNALEEQLAKIWKEVLGVEEIGIHDNFFDLGGHSLLAMQIVVRIRQNIQVELPVGAMFENPTIATLAIVIKKLLTNSASIPFRPLDRIDRDKIKRLPLSYAQQRLWFLEKMEGGHAAYNLSFAWWLRGQLNVEALRQALEEIIRRHEPLRTTFINDNGEPTQVIGVIDHLDVVLEKLRGLSSEQQTSEIERLCIAASEKPFDLSRDLMLRALLIQLEDDVHVLHLTLHHIASDGWSSDVLWREFAALYEDYVAGRPSMLPELPIQYADYSVRQREWLQDGLLHQQLNYWKKHLAGAPALLALPTDYPRPSVQRYRGAQQELILDPDLTQALYKLSRREGVTLFMTLLSAWQILLSRFSGQEDIVVGVPIAGRTRTELEGLIGFFVNTLALRTDLSGDPSFLEVLMRVREVTLEAYAHQDLPFDKLVEELHPERNLSQSPLFQVLMVLQNTPQTERKLGDLSVRSIDLPATTAKFDLSLSLQEEAGGLRGTIVYNTDLFESGTIARLACCFEQLLKEIVETPDKRIAELQLLSKNEQRELLAEAQSNVIGNSSEVLLHQLFEDQVKQTPDALALLYEDQCVTYRDLNQRANGLAQLLMAKGVGPEVFVGLIADQTPAMIVGLLAILKAGGAYVPLDPDLPASRMQFIIADANLQIIVTASAEAVPAAIGCLLVSAETVAITSDEGGIANPEAKVDGSNPIYLLYTSGSTGQPKGVIVEHRQLTNYVQAVVTEFEIEAGRHYAMLQPLFVDASQTMLFPVLGWGGTIQLISRERVLDPSALAQWFVRHPADFLKLAPSHLAALLTVSSAERLLPKKAVILGGEPLHWSLVSRILEYHPNCTIWNQYGPTESTVGVLTYQINSAGDKNRQRSATVPIGRPLANCNCYILDKHGELVPRGVVGELYIGGRTVSRGYLKRPDLTNARFVSDPYSDTPGARMYRTGDYARMLPGGEIEFLGRQDGQVKIRGMRIETGEVEATLLEHPDVAESVVLLQSSPTDDPYLVAYIVPQPGAVPTSSLLHNFICDRLPEAMRPVGYMLLERLPRLPHGKLDRKALPAIELNILSKNKNTVAPRSPIEEQLARIWCDLLGLDQVGIHDNFFDLGGHSLLAVRVTTRIASTLEIELPLRKLFESPTIAGLADAISLLKTDTTCRAVTPLERIDRVQITRFPLSFAQQRLWILEQMEGDLTAYNQPFAWRLRGSLNSEALRRALETIIRRHEPLRTTFTVNDEEPVQVIGTIERFELARVDLRGLDENQQAEEIVKHCKSEAERPFDLNCDLMLRASLLQLHDNEHVLQLTLHHIASDGWSLHQVFWRELSILYDTYCRDAKTELQNLPVQYVDYAVWQRKQFGGERLVEQLQYWKKQLEGMSSLELPTDRPRPPRPSYQGARHDFTLDLQLIRQLISLSQSENVTLHMVLLAAFQTLMSRYSGQDDVAVGTPIAGRNQTALENLIGFFVNTLVLRTDFSNDPTFRELLGRVRQVSLSALQHQDVPFEKLVEELQPERHPSRNPLVQVLFQLITFSEHSLALRDLEVSSLPQYDDRVRFDMEMHLWQSGERQKSFRGTVLYSTELFDAASIERLVGHYLTLLEGIVANPDQKISSLPLLTEPERHQLMLEWNDTASAYPSDQCVHEIFEEQAKRTPEAIALVFEEQELTYRELNERANQLAHYLLALGVGPETLVGMCLERSAEMVVSILGILKSGSAYLPLDPNYPLQRLDFILRDSSVTYIITQRQLVSRFPVIPNRTNLLVLEDALNSSLNENNPVSGVMSHNLAYSIYTSGSTGHPKGVQIVHSAVVNLLSAMARRPGLTSEDRLLSVTTPSFDISVLEIFLPLTVGACVEILPSSVVSDGVSLAHRLIKNKASVMQATPSTWQMLIQCGWNGCRNLKVLSGGELLTNSLAAALLPRIRELWNMYGPTETTIWSTTNQVIDPKCSGLIGRPIGNTQVYVLDVHGQPVPIGVAGELYIGGAGLARGYLNRPELTAEKFVTHPLSNEPGSRLYRTGDQCRWRADGNLEFLGRLDDQVKLRGFRIELGEIETILNQHPSVAQSVVVLREDRPGDKRLVAYWIGAEDTAVNVDSLPGYLRARLPEYMVPSAFVRVSAFPLTSNGKINRRALPAPERTRPELEGENVTPRNALEEQLAKIWKEVLGVEQIGIHDNFFDLGGHSLLAVQLFARIEKSFGRKLPLAVLFQHGTIGHLATLLSESNPSNVIATAMPLQTGGDGCPLVLLPSFTGEVLFSKGLIDVLGKRYPVIGIQPSLTVQNVEHFRDFRTTAQHYVNALRNYQPHGPYALLGYSMGGMMAYEVACLLNQAGEKVDLLAIIDTGPGRRGLNPSLGDYAQRLIRIIANLPSWMSEEYRHFSHSNLGRRTARKFRRLFRYLTSGGRASLKIDDVFDINRIPSQNRELMSTVFTAFYRYEPHYYPGKLTLFRAKTRPLLRGCLNDLGWGRFVESVEVHHIDGDHESILRSPHIDEINLKLAELLERQPKR